MTLRHWHAQGGPKFTRDCHELFFTPPALILIFSDLCAKAADTHFWGWPEPYIYTVYDRIFDDFPAKNTVYTPYIYRSGQPYTFLACLLVFIPDLLCNLCPQALNMQSLYVYPHTFIPMACVFESRSASFVVYSVLKVSSCLWSCVCNVQTQQVCECQKKAECYRHMMLIIPCLYTPAHKKVQFSAYHGCISSACVMRIWRQTGHYVVRRICLHGSIIKRKHTTPALYIIVCFTPACLHLRTDACITFAHTCAGLADQVWLLLTPWLCSLLTQGLFCPSTTNIRMPCLSYWGKSTELLFPLWGSLCYFQLIPRLPRLVLRHQACVFVCLITMSLQVHWFPRATQ